MSKYAPLGAFLASTGRDEVRMSFRDIEDLIGFSLPPSAHKHRAWWSNNASNNVMAHAWKDAGYRSARVDMAGETLVFERCASPRPNAPVTASLNEEPAAFAGAGDGPPSRPHPLLGLFRGRIRASDPAALMAPAAPDWEAETLAKHDRAVR